jgi:hypothetical protein
MLEQRGGQAGYFGKHPPFFHPFPPDVSLGKERPPSRTLDDLLETDEAYAFDEGYVPCGPLDWSRRPLGRPCNRRRPRKERHGGTIASVDHDEMTTAPAGQAHLASSHPLVGDSISRRALVAVNFHDGAAGRERPSRATFAQPRLDGKPLALGERRDASYVPTCGPSAMPRPPRSPPVSDIVYPLVILVTAAVLAWPVMTGGHRIYIDNPVHLAELTEMIAGRASWSDIAFTGFPLGDLHSPLWYPLLAATARAGVALEELYRVALFAGFVAPSLALFAVARRHAAPLPSLLLALLLLCQPPWLRGVGSPLAGMWTHGLGVALVICFAELTSRPRLTRGALGAWAATLALIGLTHHFALLAAVVLALGHFIFGREPDDLRAETLRRLVAAAIAAMASGAYWLTFLWTSRPEFAPWDRLPALALACRTLLPCDVLYLVDGRLEEAIRWDLHLVDAIPMWTLLALGVAAALHRATRPSALVRAGGMLASIFLLALVVHGYVVLKVLGPVSWRHLDWVRVGAALAAIPLVDRLAARLPRFAHYFAPALFMLSAFGLGKPLRSDRPAATEPELEELEEAWRFIREHRNPEWGRLYVSGTFGANWASGGLSHSHVLALTHARTGALQVGTYYGVVPFRTRWTLSEFNWLYSTRHSSLEALTVKMQKTNSRAVLTSDPHRRAWFAEQSEFRELMRHGRYGLFELRSGESEWIAPLAVSNRITEVDFRPGDIAFTFESDRERARVVAKASWHRWWTLDGPPGARIVETPDGLLGIVDLPSGTHRLHLAYRPSPWPGRLSILGFTFLLGWGISLVGQRRPRATSPVQ